MYTLPGGTAGLSAFFPLWKNKTIVEISVGTKLRIQKGWFDHPGGSGTARNSALQKLF